MSWPDRVGLWWGTLEGADLETLIAAAAHAGFTDISLTPAMYFAARLRGRTDAELRARLADGGVHVAMVDPLIAGLPGSKDPATIGRRWRPTFEHDEADCWRVAAALGADAINIAHFLGSPTPLDHLAEAIGGVAERAGGEGVNILVEFMPEGSIRTLFDAVAVCSQVASNCTVMVDTWHLWRTDGGAGDLAGVPTGLIGGVQLGDATNAVRGSYANPPEHDRRMPGDGDLPLRPMLDAIWSSGSDPVIGVEVFDRHWSTRGPNDVADAARAACRAVLERDGDGGGYRGHDARPPRRH